MAHEFASNMVEVCTDMSENANGGGGGGWEES